MKIKVKIGKNGIAEVEQSSLFSEHFSFAEISNLAGDRSQPVFEVTKEVYIFFGLLEKLRSWYAKPISVNSCFRQPAYNRKIGGMSNSLHLRGLALDWGVLHTESQRENVEKKWAEICAGAGRVGEIIYYDWGYHLSAYADLQNAKKFRVLDYRKKGAKKR